MKHKTIALAIGSMALMMTACAPLPPGSLDAGPGYAGAMRFALNGLRGVVGGQYNLGGFERLPSVRSQSDYMALNATIQRYQSLVPQYIARGDYDSALFANHIAARLIDYRLKLASGTQRAVGQMLANPDAPVALQPGDIAILPAHWAADAAPMPSMNRGWSQGETPRPVLLAGGDDAALRDAIRLAQWSAPPQAQPRTMQPQELSRLPVGQAVTLSDGTIVERTADSLVLHNPTGTVKTVKPENLGYQPPIRPLSQTRMDAGRIMKNIGVSLNTVLSMAPPSGGWTANRIMNHEHVVPPNRIDLDRHEMDESLSTDVKQPTTVLSKTLSVTGEIARSNDEAARSYAEYRRSSSPFRAAVDITAAMENAPAPRAFGRQCVRERHTQTRTLRGEFAEILAMECRPDRQFSGAPLYVKEYFVFDHNTIQTWKSRMQDKDVADKLRRADQFEDAVQNMAQLLPIAGNIESGFACYNPAGFSPAKTLARAMNSESSATLQKQRVFVTDVYDLNKKFDPNSVTDVGARALDCAAAIPMLGQVGKFGALGAEKLGMMGRHITERGADFARAMNLFETSLLSGKRWTETATMVEQYASRSPGMALLAKSTYDAAQTARNFTQFSSAMGVFGGG